jgi:hypothetical protein
VEPQGSIRRFEEADLGRDEPKRIHRGRGVRKTRPPLIPYEREVALRELINEELSEKQRKYAADMAAEFEKVFRDARHHFEELFQAGAESRPSSVADLVSRLQVSGGAFWGFGKVLYRHPSEVPPDEETVRRFVPALSRTSAGALCCPI